MRWALLLTLTAACGFEVSATGRPDDARADSLSHDAAPGDGPADSSNPDSPDGPPPAGIVFIAEAHDQHADNGHDTVSVSLAAPAAGHSYIAVLSWYAPSVQVKAVSDTANNTYLFADGVSTGTLAQRTYYVPRANANATSQNVTITASWTAHAQFCELRVLEYAGLAATGTFDKAMASGGANDALMSVGPLVTASANELLVASFTGNATGAGAMYTQRLLYVGDLEEDRIAATAGAYTATAPAGSGAWVGELTAFNGQ